MDFDNYPSIHPSTWSCPQLNQILKIALSHHEADAFFIYDLQRFCEAQTNDPAEKKHHIRKSLYSCDRFGQRTVGILLFYSGEYVDVEFV